MINFGEYDIANFSECKNKNIKMFVLIFIPYNTRNI